MRSLGDAKAPIEVRNLLNPAFCLLLLREAIKGYEANSTEGMPFTKTFFVLPLVLPANMRKVLPNIARGYLVNWAIENPSAVVEIHDLLLKTKTVTQDSLLLGLQCGLLKFTSEDCFKINGRMRKRPDASFTELLGRALSLGKWLAKFSEVDIFSQFNITP